MAKDQSEHVYVKTKLREIDKTRIHAILRQTTAIVRQTTETVRQSTELSVQSSWSQGKTK